MKYKLELITDVPELDVLIAETSSQLFVLRNNRDDRLIQAQNGAKSLDRHTKAIRESEARRDSALTMAATLPDGAMKNKQLGIVETEKARLFNLNLPQETSSEKELVDNEIDREEHEALIAFRQDVLDNLNARRKQLTDPA